jgi:hypothetical protein
VEEELLDRGYSKVSKGEKQVEEYSRRMITSIAEKRER